MRPVVAAPGRTCLDAIAAHQPGNPVFPDLHPQVFELAVNTRAAIGAAAFLVHAPDLRTELLVLLHPSTDWPLAPRVITRARNAVNATHQRYFVLGPVCFDEFED